MKCVMFLHYIIPESKEGVQFKHAFHMRTKNRYWQDKIIQIFFNSAFYGTP